MSLVDAVNGLVKAVEGLMQALPMLSLLNIIIYLLFCVECFSWSNKQFCKGRVWNF